MVLALAVLAAMVVAEPVTAGSTPLGEQCEAAAKLGPDLKAQRERAKILGALPDEEGCEGPITVYVDPDLAAPAVRTQPGFDGKTPRLVAGMLDSSGDKSQFVTDEVVVVSKDADAVKAFAQRWSGTILQSFLPKNSDETRYLIRVKPEPADPSRLSEDLGKINEGHSKAETLAVSSDAALRLLALTSQEALAGGVLTVGLNWLQDTMSYASRSLAEAGTGPVGFTDNPADPYSRDPYRWSYMDKGSVQDIGVSEAWTLMDSVGLFANKVDITVLDQGFSPVVNDDLPPGTTTSSTVPFSGGTDIGSDSAAPWHGTQVASALAGVPGNFKGSAGPAGPVANLRLAYTGMNIWGAMVGLTDAVARGADLIDMSFGDRWHWALSFTLLPLDGLTALLRATSDTLMFASAGNDGANVDGTTCFITCWEKYWYAPCENSGVICVGGLKRNSLDRDPQSNHGEEDVDIFAPFTVLVGMDPNHTTPNKTWAASGTSFAAPYAVGVAALIWAAHPNLSADSVEDILMDHRRLSPDGTIKKKVINALDSVRDAMPAAVQITTPLDGWTLPAGSPSVFQATVFDDGNGVPAVSWRTGWGVNLGTGNPLSAIPPLGPQWIIATATFPNGVTASDSVVVNVFNGPPTVTITNPTSGSPAFGVTEPIPFHAISVDDVGPLPDAAIQWFLDGATTPFATGHNPTVVTGGGVGTHTVRVRGCDNFSVCDDDSVVLTLATNPVNQPPVVHIVSPANGAVLWVTGSDATGWYADVQLQATASDPEGGPLVTQWFDNGTPVATGLAPTVRLRGGCGIVPHMLTFAATDSVGNTRQDTVNTTVDLIC